MSAPYSISKTSFLKFDQCAKAFFLYKKHPYLRDKVDIDKQLTFKRGHDVGFFAQQLFPGGTDVSKASKNTVQAIELTASLLLEKKPVIYEATFVYNGVLIMVDILCLHDNKYTAYEVKSSIRVSETYIKDACLQYYVLKNTLPSFDDLFLVTLNSDYVLHDEINVKQLFKKRSVKLKAEENFSFFEHQIKKAHDVLDQNVIPNIPIGRQCFKPYVCDFFGSCWKNDLTDTSIFNLPLISRDKLFDLHAVGIKNIDQLRDGDLEKESHVKIKNVFVSGIPIKEKDKIGNFLSSIKQPMAAMDMEIWNPAIPQLKGTKPFEQIPFLVCFYDGLQEEHFFTGNETDQRRQFAENLLTMSDTYATILVYDKTMEVIAIDNLSKLFADLRDGLQQLKTKLADIFEVFLNLYYYHPDFKSNFSLKMVSSHLLTGIDYSDIASGLEAMSRYESFRLENDTTEKQKIREQLVAYCAMDSLATYRLVDAFQRMMQ